MSKTSKNSWFRNFVWILPALCFIGASVYYSIGFTFRLSLVDWNGMLSVPMKEVGLDNYKKVFSDPVFYKCIKNTVVFFVVTFVIQNFLGFIFAAILHSDVKLVTIHKCLIFIPTILAPATMAPVFRLLFSPQGLLQSIFDTLHLPIAVNWLSRPTTSLIVLMVVAIWQYTGMSFILYYAAMSQIDGEMLEAAQIDGAGNIRILWSMVFPGCRGTTVSMAMLGVIGALKTFDLPWLITPNSLMHATEFLGTYIYRLGVKQAHFGLAAALSVCLLVLAVLGALLTSRANKAE